MVGGVDRGSSRARVRFDQTGRRRWPAGRAVVLDKLHVVIVKKSRQEIEKMAAAGAVQAAALDLVASKIRPGVTTAELDAAVERFIRSQGAVPTFKGYRGFPGSICASPNSMVVHGIPGRYRLARGDILSVDIGVTLDGWVADAARTFPVGAVGAGARNLLSATEAALHAGVGQCVVGNRIGDVSSAIQRVAEGAGLSVVRSLVGHGVGKDMHEDPQVPNYGRPGKGALLEEGMVLAIEPMTTAGRAAVRVAGDGWAIFSQDDSLAAHFEFTVAIAAQGPRILTPWHLPAAERVPGGSPNRQVASA
jgi:methionyl aminopeptidase